MSEHQVGTEIGIVKEAAEGKAVVVLEKNEHCHSCTLCKPAEDGMILTVRDPLGVSPGDKVAIGRPSEAILKATFFVFIFPLISMITFAFLGRTLFPQWGDLSLILGTLFGIAFGIVVAQVYDRRLSPEKKDRMLPEIEKVLK